VYWPVTQEVWQELQPHGIKVSSSSLAHREVLVKPEKDSDQALAAAHERFLLRDGFGLVPICQAILRQAARLRAETGLRTPDAIHAAAALAEGCDLLVTNDVHFRKIPHLNVAVLSDLVTP
jgi:predicted nucleic acid-binding protein